MAQSVGFIGLGLMGQPMALNLVKVALLASLAILTLGIIPDRRRGAVIAIAACVAAAVVLHFVAP